MLHAIRNVGGQEPCVRVGQEVVDRIAFRDGTVVNDRVHVVVIGTGTELSFQQAGCNELQCRRDDQLAGTGGDQQTTFVSPTCDLDDCVFKRGLRQVNLGRRGVAVGATGYQRVSSAEQSHAVTTCVVRREAVVQNRCRFYLLGVRHRTGERLGVTSRQGVIEVVLDGLFGQAETQSDSLVVVACSPSFLAVVVANCRTFVLDRCCREAGQLGLFFERTLRGLGLVDLFVLFAVTVVLHAKQGVKARQELFQ